MLYCIVICVITNVLGKECPLVGKLTTSEVVEDDEADADCVGEVDELIIHFITAIFFSVVVGGAQSDCERVWSNVGCVRQTASIATGVGMLPHLAMACLQIYTAQQERAHYLSDTCNCCSWNGRGVMCAIAAGK